MESRPLVVVGAGAAGIAAAIEAARAGAHVTLVDENPIPTSIVALNIPQLFGQRFSDELNDAQLMMDRVTASNQRLAEAEEAGVEIQLGTCVWGAFNNTETSRLLDGPQIGLSNYRRSWMVKFGRLIVATGARDLSFGFSGWHLNGTIGANGVHSLITCYRALTARRMVIIGSGNLAQNTAKMALDHGIDVPAVVEVSPTLQGDDSLATDLQNRGTDIYTSHTISRAYGRDGEIESVTIVEIDDHARPITGTEKTITADTVCLAIGLTPNVELLNLLGCDLTFNADLGGHIPIHDDAMRTSIENVLAAGDAAGVHDAMVLNPEIARNQGRIAGLTAAASLRTITDAEAEARISDIPIVPFAPSDTQSRWQKWFDSFANAGGHDIYVCPCEEVTRADIVGIHPPRYLEWRSNQMDGRSLQTQLQDNPVNPNQIKRLTRAGTGTCQGRHCREQVALLLAEESNTDVSQIPLSTYRPPVRPLPLSVLWPEDESEEIRNQWPKWFHPPGKVLG